MIQGGRLPGKSVPGNALVAWKRYIPTWAPHLLISCSLASIHLWMGPSQALCPFGHSEGIACHLLCIPVTHPSEQRHGCLQHVTHPPEGISCARTMPERAKER